MSIVIASNPESNLSWKTAVLRAVSRLVESTGEPVFSRQQLIEHELQRMIQCTESSSNTPLSSMDRALHRLIEEKELLRIKKGVYRVDSDAKASTAIQGAQLLSNSVECNSTACIRESIWYHI